ncbi:MAG TPA: group 1 truncated hemoglobin [Gemmatimonadota bacterium]|nr:group 1 truncated hemoglobin [Gemmatimonadota bacterium]
MIRSFARLCVPALSVIAALALAACQAQDGEPVDQIEPDTVDTATAGPEQSLYDRLGGETAIASVVDTFVARAAADAELNFTRQGTANEWEATPENVDLLKERLVQFVGQATGGPQVYEGEDMGAAHEGMAITDAEFDRLGGHFQGSLDAHAVPAAEQDELLAIVETTRGAIVTAP